MRLARVRRRDFILRGKMGGWLLCKPSFFINSSIIGYDEFLAATRAGK
jgi:hypothetical protein